MEQLQRYCAACSRNVRGSRNKTSRLRDKGSMIWHTAGAAASLKQAMNVRSWYQVHAVRNGEGCGTPASLCEDKERTFQRLTTSSRELRTNTLKIDVYTYFEHLDKGVISVGTLAGVWQR